MDVQFYGANCLVFSSKDFRVVIDDNLTELGQKTVAKPGDITLFTMRRDEEVSEPKLMFDMPGEYEVGNVSIVGIPARSHLDEDPKATRATMYKLTVSDIDYLVTGHIYPELDERQLESIGMVDVMFVPMGGNGYTLDAVGALKIIKVIEPKLVIPTHYADKALKYEVPQQALADALKDIAVEVAEPTSKLKIKSSAELAEIMHIQVLEKTT